MFECLVDFLHLLGECLELVQRVHECEALRPPENLRDINVVDPSVHGIHLGQEHVLLPNQQPDEDRGVLALDRLDFLLLLNQLVKVAVRVTVGAQEDRGLVDERFLHVLADVRLFHDLLPQVVQILRVVDLCIQLFQFRPPLGELSPQLLVEAADKRIMLRCVIITQERSDGLNLVSCERLERRVFLLTHIICVHTQVRPP